MSDGQPAPTDLSTREREVADAYAAGQSYKEIARELGLSPTTVRSHLRTVYGKLGVTSKIELARFLTDETAPDATRDTGELAAEMALELDEAMRRERSLAKVLRIISDQDGELDAVIDAVLEHALEICEAEYGHLFEYHGDFMFSEMRSRGISPAFAAWLSEMGIFRVEPTTGVGRAAAELKPVSITDIRAGGLYETGSPLRVASVDFGKGRSLAAIPMMSGNRLIGVFSVYRTRVHPFNERALELVQLFADQAAIAIENVRRFRQLQARAERDAATREILQVLSESRDDESPVFDAILENACKLCDAPLAYLSMVTEDRTHVVSPARVRKFRRDAGQAAGAARHLATGARPRDRRVQGVPRGRHIRQRRLQERRSQPGLDGRGRGSAQPACRPADSQRPRDLVHHVLPPRCRAVLGRRRSPRRGLRRTGRHSH